MIDPGPLLGTAPATDPTGGDTAPRVTVVVITRDRCDNVLRTLGHLLALPEQPPVILVDNGSSDGTVESVRRRFPDVHLLPLEENHGAPARTVGVAAATTPYVAFADDDSWWAPGSLSHAAELFDSHPRVGLLGARILIGEQERLDPVCRLMGDSPLPTEPGALGPSVLGFVACGAVVRRTAYLQVGGFSPVVFFLGEEKLLAQDLMVAGWQLAYVDDVVAHHHPNSVGSGRSGRDRLAVRNELLTTWMRRPAGVALRRSVAVVRARHDRAGLTGLVDALRRAPRALAARCVLPPHVEQQVCLLE